LREILADIRTADVHATEIIERHRAMLRNHRLETKPIDIHAVVRESVTLIARDTNERQIQVNVDVPPVPCIVTGDHVLLEQVVVNLMVNAMDAMTDTPAGRRRITVHSEMVAQGVKISVCDAGTGLAASLQGKLFEPFVTTKANGMGIGLAIARTIVQTHGGSIDAENNANGGATFAVTLPCTEAAVHV
jgi:C4-dicarboxylate-specific signal transduction histidine kinase